MLRFALVIFVLLMALCIFFLVKRFHKFYFVQKIAKKHKFLSWVISILPFCLTLFFLFVNVYAVIIVYQSFGEDLFAV